MKKKDKTKYKINKQIQNLINFYYAPIYCLHLETITTNVSEVWNIDDGLRNCLYETAN
jgi:hypothetical protein